MNVYKTYDGQSFFDIAMHRYGDASMAVHIAIAAGVAVSDQPAGEVPLPAADDTRYSAITVQAIAGRGIIPATRLTPENEVNPSNNRLWWDGYLHPDDFQHPEMSLFPG
jgi:hypothetical protein